MTDNTTSTGLPPQQQHQQQQQQATIGGQQIVTEDMLKNYINEMRRRKEAAIASVTQLRGMQQTPDIRRQISDGISASKDADSGMRKYEEYLAKMKEGHTFTLSSSTAVNTGNSNSSGPTQAQVPPGNASARQYPQQQQSLQKKASTTSRHPSANTASNNNISNSSGASSNNANTMARQRHQQQQQSAYAQGYATTAMGNNSAQAYGNMHAQRSAVQSQQQSTATMPTGYVGSGQGQQQQRQQPQQMQQSQQAGMQAYGSTPQMYSALGVSGKQGAANQRTASYQQYPAQGQGQGHFQRTPQQYPAFQTPSQQQNTAAPYHQQHDHPNPTTAAAKRGKGQLGKRGASTAVVGNATHGSLQSMALRQPVANMTPTQMQRMAQQTTPLQVQPKQNKGGALYASDPNTRPMAGLHSGNSIAAYATQQQQQQQQALTRQVSGYPPVQAQAPHQGQQRPLYASPATPTSARLGSMVPAQEAQRAATPSNPYHQQQRQHQAHNLKGSATRQRALSTTSQQQQQQQHQQQQQFVANAGVDSIVVAVEPVAFRAEDEAPLIAQKLQAVSPQDRVMRIARQFPCCAPGCECPCYMANSDYRGHNAVTIPCSRCQHGAQQHGNTDRLSPIEIFYRAVVAESFRTVYQRYSYVRSKPNQGHLLPALSEQTRRLWSITKSAAQVIPPPFEAVMFEKLKANIQDGRPPFEAGTIAETITRAIPLLVKQHGLKQTTLKKVANAFSKFINAYTLPAPEIYACSYLPVVSMAHYDEFHKCWALYKSKTPASQTHVKVFGRSIYNALRPVISEYFHKKQTDYKSDIDKKCAAVLFNALEAALAGTTAVLPATRPVVEGSKGNASQQSQSSKALSSPAPTVSSSKSAATSKSKKRRASQSGSPAARRGSTKAAKASDQGHQQQPSRARQGQGSGSHQAPTSAMADRLSMQQSAQSSTRALQSHDSRQGKEASQRLSTRGGTEAVNTAKPASEGTSQHAPSQGSTLTGSSESRGPVARRAPPETSVVTMKQMLERAGYATKATKTGKRKPSRVMVGNKATPLTGSPVTASPSHRNALAASDPPTSRAAKTSDSTQRDVPSDNDEVTYLETLSREEKASLLTIPFLRKYHLGNLDLEDLSANKHTALTPQTAAPATATKAAHAQPPSKRSKTASRGQSSSAERNRAEQRDLTVSAPPFDDQKLTCASLALLSSAADLSDEDRQRAASAATTLSRKKGAALGKEASSKAVKHSTKAAATRDGVAHITRRGVPLSRDGTPLSGRGGRSTDTVNTGFWQRRSTDGGMGHTSGGDGQTMSFSPEKIRQFRLDKELEGFSLNPEECTQKFLKVVLAKEPPHANRPVSMVKKIYGKETRAKEEFRSKLLQVHIASTLRIHAGAMNSTTSNHHVELLMGVRDLFCACLVGMPREYITKTVFDVNHKSLILTKGSNVVGAVCFRPFFEHSLIEIVFVAVYYHEHLKGYGSFMMTHLKDYAARCKCQYLITYADEHAVGYFKKQEFSRTLTFPSELTRGLVKLYQGGYLMECVLHLNMSYLDSSAMVARQLQATVDRVADQINKIPARSGATVFLSDGVIPIESIPGISETRWARDGSYKRPPPNQELDKATVRWMKGVLKDLRSHDAAWPFKAPVNVEHAPDYYEVIKEPMDLRTIGENVRNQKYNSQQEFISDVKKIFANCYTYNDESTTFYEAGKDLERYFHTRLALDAAAPS